MERDDELRAILLVHRSLMKLRDPAARARVVRYMVDRHIESSEPAGLPVSPDDHGEPPPTPATPKEARDLATATLGRVVATGGAPHEGQAIP